MVKSVETYRSNVRSLNVIANNLSKDLKRDKDEIIIRTNKTNSANPDNSNTNETATITNLKQKMLYSSVTGGAVGGSLMVCGIICAIILKNLLPHPSILILNTALIHKMSFIPTITALSWYPITPATFAVLNTILWVTVSLSVVLILASLTCLITYIGIKKGWWKL